MRILFFTLTFLLIGNIQAQVDLLKHPESDDILSTWFKHIHGRELSKENEKDYQHYA